MDNGTVRVAKFRKMRPAARLLLRAELLQPGDVILSGQKTAPSTVIRRATRGTYSHAQLVLTTVWRFDATAEGVGFKAANIVKCERQPDGAIRFLEDIGQLTRFDVFRHPALEATPATEKTAFADRLSSIAIELQGRQYSELKRLLDVPTTLDQYPRIKRAVANVLDRLDAKKKIAKKINPGHFCSELVVSIYKQLGVELFSEDLVPGSVGPSLLADTRVCYLRRVAGITTHADPGKPNVADLLELFRSQTRSPMNERDRQVQLKTDAIRAMKGAQFVSEALDRAIRLLKNAGKGRPLA